MRDRNWRRGQRERAIARASRYHYLSKDYWGSEEDRQAAIRHAAITPHPCSRYCCGNPRRWFAGDERYTRQEHKAFLSTAEQLSEAQSYKDNANEDVDCGGKAVAEDNRWRD